MDLKRFAEEVGSEGPVTVVGGRTQWDAGGNVDAAAREVRAPSGIAEFEPAEMTVRCGAGTTVGELSSVLAEAGQCVALDGDDAATIGGVLAVGRSGIRRLRQGPMRDVLLQARYVSADGVVIKGGGATVKNVSGFDLCRLLVASLGTLGFLGEVILRCRPLPAVSRWFAGEAEPFSMLHSLHQPSSILWDGSTTWVLLEGHPADVEAQADIVALPEVEGPPPLPTGGRRSMPPAALRTLAGTFVAEVGVGIVHAAEPTPVVELPAEVAELNRRVKTAFDPTGRLNPGRQVA